MLVKVRLWELENKDPAVHWDAGLTWFHPI